MSITRDSRGIFLLKDDQLVTLKNLGRICGIRLKKAARLCGEDSQLLAVMILSRFCNRFGRFEHGKMRLREMLHRGWRAKHGHSAFAPQKVVDAALDSYTQKYSHRILQLLGRFLAKRTSGNSVSDGLGNDNVLAQIVIYAANAERCSFSDNHVSGSIAWRSLCRIFREEKKRAEREHDLTVSRDRAMSFLASIFLAQLLSAYRVEPETAFLDFAIALYDSVTDAS